MSRKTELNVIIVTFNSEPFIEKLVGTLSQIVKQGSIYIWDNGSTDGTVETIKDNFLEVHLYESDKNIGFSTAVNNLINRSKKSFILIINPDTVPNCEAIDLLYKCIKKNAADIVGGKMRTKQGVLHRSYVHIPNAQTVAFDFTNLCKIFKNNRWHRHFYYLDSKITETTEVDAVSGGYMIVRRESFNKLKGFDEKYFMYLEDIDLCKRAGSMGMKILYCPSSQIVHEGGGSSANKHKINYLAWDKSRLHYVHKNFSGITKLLLSLLLTIDIVISAFKRE